MSYFLSKVLNLSRNLVGTSSCHVKYNLLKDNTVVLSVEVEEIPSLSCLSELRSTSGPRCRMY